ncbi:MAG: OmpA family protein [Bacteroidota bacterium]|nr:OmpA family protein [Bacteroidota bacterium]
MGRYLTGILVFLLFSSAIAGQTHEQVSFSNDNYSSKWDLNIHGSPARTRLKSNKFGNEEKITYGYNGGLDLAYYFIAGEKLKFGLSAGVNYSFYKALRILNYNDSIKTVDADNDQFTLYQKGDNIRETQNASFIDIPVLLRLEYVPFPHFGVYLHAGGYYSSALNAKYNISMTYTAKGYYPKYNVLLHDIDVPNSPYFFPTNKPMSGQGSLQVKSSYGITVAFGLKYKLTPNIALTAGVSSYMGMTNLSAYSKSNWFLVNSNRSINTLMSRGDKITENAYCVDFGLSITLWKRIKPTDKPIIAKESISVPEAPKDIVKLTIPRIAEIKDTIKKENAIIRILVSGKLVDLKTSNPLHAKVVFKENNTVKGMASSPATTGRFNLILTQGMYDYEISSPGYIPIVDKLDLTETNQPVKLPDLMLTPITPGPIFQFNNVSFQNGTNVITEQSYATLDLVGKLLTENPSMQLEVGCHTDNTGNETANLTLSQQRANTIVRYLTNKGATAVQLKATGYGSSMPITDNYTEYGRSQNRRVEFKVLKIINLQEK